MNGNKHTLSLATAALLIGVALSGAQALDVGGVSIGGGDSGGTSVSAGAGGDTSASATVGGGSNIANAMLGTGGNTVNANIGNTPGDLITTDTSNGATQANVNLGGLGLDNGPVNGVTDPLGDTLGGIDLGGLGLPGLGGGAGGGGAGGGGGGTISPTQVGAAFGGLAPQDQRILRDRCGQVLASPGSYAAGVVSLCRVIARL